MVRKRLGIRILMGVGIALLAFIIYALFLKSRSATNTQGTQGTSAGNNIQYIPVTGDSFTTEAINQQGSNNTNSTVGGDTTTTGNTTTTSNTQNDTTPPPAPPPKHTIHVVQAGETLSSIAAKYGISLAELEKTPGNWTTVMTYAHRHGVTSNEWDHIYVGEPIYIPQ